MFTLYRISSETYDRLIAGEREWEPTAAPVSLGKSWAVLFRFLNFGEDAASPKRVALAVSGGVHLDPYGDYGGSRVLSPQLVADIVYDLDDGDAPEEYREPLDEEEIRRRHQYVDQTGAYSAGEHADSVAAAFRTLDAFYRGAAAAGDAVRVQWW